MIRQKIPAFRLVKEPLEPEAAALKPFKWAGPVMGTRHQLGGEPLNLQREKWPKCPSCNEEMTFYGQLDSPNDDYCLADCGLIQVFVCFDCFQTTSRLTTY
jgi:hypothetical protein